MAKAGMTISDAAHEWVREMNAYPQEMIETLMQAKPDDWHEVTMPRVCDRVYVCNLPDGCEDYDPNGEIENIAGDVYLVNLEDGNTVELGADDFEVERDSILPMWGWLWSFSDSADDYFIDELECCDPEEDVEWFCNCLDTSIWFKDNEEIYRKYLEDEISDIEENMGFEF